MCSWQGTTITHGPAEGFNDMRAEYPSPLFAVKEDHWGIRLAFGGEFRNCLRGRCGPDTIWKIAVEPNRATATSGSPPGKRGGLQCRSPL